MIGVSTDTQPSMFYHINVEQLLCEPLYAYRGRPSISPEQLFLALLGGYLLEPISK